LKQVKCFKYFGAMIKLDGRGTAEAKCRIGWARVAFQKIKILYAIVTYQWK
jgi:hypothetical protein